MSEYPQKVRFNGVIDGVENPVFELGPTHAPGGIAYGHATEYSWSKYEFQAWQVQAMPDKFTPIEPEPEPPIIPLSELIRQIRSLSDDLSSQRRKSRKTVSKELEDICANLDRLVTEGELKEEDNPKEKL